MYKMRLVGERLKRLAATFSAVVVSGARQVGKSTLLAHTFPEVRTVVFDPVVDVGGARADPDLFLDNHPPPVVLDEIQYAAELVPSIKRRIDANREPGQYLITGSQQWNVMKAIAESLAGRVVFVDLESFCLREMAERTQEITWLERWLQDPELLSENRPVRLGLPRTVNELIWRGSLPETDRLEEAVIPDFFAGYLRTYIERDVRVLADVADWQQFGRFVRLTSALTAQEVNYSQLGRDIGMTPQTAQRWLAVLRATFQWFEVPAYSGNALKRVSRKPKGYFADTGLACHLQMLSSPAALDGHPLAGALFESAVAGEIRKLCARLPTPPAVYHWRSHGGAEVDLLLDRDGMLFPIEIKLSSHPRKSDTRGVSAFREAHPNRKIAPGLVIAPTAEFGRVSSRDFALPWDC